MTSFQNLFVAKIPHDATDNDLMRIFGRFNPVSAKVMLDAASGTSKGFGFVLFNTEEEGAVAHKALDRSTAEVNGRTFTVNACPSKYDARVAAHHSPSLYIRNIPRSYPQAEVDKLLNSFGRVVSSILRDEPNGFPVWVIYVRYERQQDADAALNALHNNHQMFPDSDVPVLAKYAKQKTNDNANNTTTPNNNQRSSNNNNNANSSSNTDHIHSHRGGGHHTNHQQQQPMMMSTTSSSGGAMGSPSASSATVNVGSGAAVGVVGIGVSVGGGAPTTATINTAATNNNNNPTSTLQQPHTHNPYANSPQDGVWPTPPGAALHAPHIDGGLHHNDLNLGGMGTMMGGRRRSGGGGGAISPNTLSLHHGGGYGGGNNNNNTRRYSSGSTPNLSPQQTHFAPHPNDARRFSTSSFVQYHPAPLLEVGAGDDTAGALNATQQPRKPSMDLDVLQQVQNPTPTHMSPGTLLTAGGTHPQRSPTVSPTNKQIDSNGYYRHSPYGFA